MAVISAAACAESDRDVADGPRSDGNKESTTTESTTTTEAGPTDAELLCDSLTSDSYESRKQALEQYIEYNDVADAPCSEHIENLEAAVAIEELAGEVADAPVEIQIQECADNVTSVINNTSDIALGVATVGYRRAGTEQRRADPTSRGTGHAVWRIEPGVEATATGIFFDRTIPGPYTPPGPECGVEIRKFLSDTSAADASLPGETATGDQASGNPEVWVPALFQREDEWRLAGDPDGVAATEDIRSTEYARLVNEATRPDPSAAREYSLEICTIGPNPESADLVSIQYSLHLAPYNGPDKSGETVDWPEETNVYFGMFRRGADGLWRWLHAAQFVHQGDCNVGA